MEALPLRYEKDGEERERKGDRYSLLTQIGNTPLIQIRQLTRHLRKVQIYAKAEWLNPGGSLKDRSHPGFRWCAH